MRYRKVIHSIATIGCKNQGPEEVTACCIEPSYIDGIPTIIRVTQNRRFSPDDIAELQSLIDTTVQNVLKIPRDQLLDRKSKGKYYSQ